MITLDTNVIIRILVDDPDHPKQNEQARKLATKHEKFFIPTLVQAEMIWVLARAYHFKKPSLVKALEELQENAAFILENDDDFAAAVEYYQSTSCDFADALILAAAKRSSALKVYTFDKKFAKMANVQLVTGHT